MDGTFDDNGTTGLLLVRAGESCALALSVTNTEEFVGKIRVEYTEDGGLTFKLATNVDGVDLEFDGIDDPLADSIIDTVIRNEGPKRRRYRIIVSDFDGDDLIWSLTDVEGDVVEILLRDGNGNPVIGRRDDGGIQLYGPLAGAGDGAQLQLVGPFATSEAVLTDPADPDNKFVSEKYVEVLISAADIIDVAAGKFGHAAGYPLVEDPDASSVIELVSAVLVYDRVTATFGAGGNVTINENGGAAVTGLISAGNSVGGGADKIVQFDPLAAAARNMTLGKGLNLVAAAAFTNPGTAAGTVKVRVRYREHFTGL